MNASELDVPRILEGVRLVRESIACNDLDTAEEILAAMAFALTVTVCEEQSESSIHH